MFEQETEIIRKTVVQRTIANQPAVAVKDILAADIPYPLKTFLRADVELLLLDELHCARNKTRFNFDHPEVKSLQMQMNSVLVLHFSFERDEFLRRIDDTVHLIINYLLRPQWTLTNVLFEKEDSIPTSTLLRMLKYFGPYEYLKEIIGQYTREKPVASFSRKELSTLLWKIDGEYVRRKAGDEIARIMSPIYEFLDYPKNSGAKALPVKALIKYFEDKGMTSATNRLEGEIIQGRTELPQRVLGEILEDVRRTSGAFDVQPVDDRATGQRQEPVRGEPTSPKAEAAEGPGITDTTVRTIDILESDRRKFIKRIFRDNEASFESAIRSLQSLPNWKEASVVIDEVFIQNDVDPYSSEAERFIKTLYQQYHPTR